MPATFTSALAVMLVESFSTSTQLVPCNFHNHVPAELAPETLVGKTAHHVPAWFHTLDCGFSPVEAVIGLGCRTVQARPLGGGGVLLGVCVAVGVGVFVGIPVNVAVGVLVSVCEGVAVAVGVSVGVGKPVSAWISAGDSARL